MSDPACSRPGADSPALQHHLGYATGEVSMYFIKWFELLKTLWCFVAVITCV